MAVPKQLFQTSQQWALAMLAIRKPPTTQRDAPYPDVRQHTNSRRAQSATTGERETTTPEHNDHRGERMDIDSSQTVRGTQEERGGLQIQEPQRRNARQGEKEAV